MTKFTKCHECGIRKWCVQILLSDDPDDHKGYPEWRCIQDLPNEEHYEDQATELREKILEIQ